MSFAQQCLYRMLRNVDDETVRRTHAALCSRPWRTLGDLTTRSVFTFYLDPTYKLEIEK